MTDLTRFRLLPNLEAKAQEWLLLCRRALLDVRVTEGHRILTRAPGAGGH